MIVIDRYQENAEYAVQEKLSNGQTLEMRFSCDNPEIGQNCMHWNISLSIYNKRKDSLKNEREKKITGQVPIESYFIAKKAFNLLEKEVLSNFYYVDIILYCTWTDSRRREAYHAFLSKRGFMYKMVEGRLCIAKTYKKPELS